MTTRSDLEERAAAGKSLEDFIELAKEATLLEPADPGYAKELLQKAEMQCQMPLDYIKAGDLAASSLNDMEYAKDLYEQAEDMLFEASEFIAYAKSMAKYVGDKDKAREYLEKAADEANEPAELLSMSSLAQSELEDEELGKSLLAKVEDKVKTFDDYLSLAKSLQDGGDEDASKTFFKKAARFCDDVPATVNYAQHIREIYDDNEWARQTLDDAEMDCQFTKDFVALASGYKNLFDDNAKMQELMQQAEEFCMTGEERIDLAEGLWTLLQDKEKAAENYTKALVDVTDKDMLLELARKSAVELQDMELAKKIYAKAEERMSSASDLSKLAQAVISDLQDKDYAGQVYARAGESMVAPNDLVKLGSDIVAQLGDPELAATMYRKAFDNAGDCKQLLKLVAPVKEKLDDSAFVKEILQKAEQSAEGSSDLLEIGTAILTELDDKTFAKNVLEAAEERVASLGEMKSVAEQIKQHYGEDDSWIERVTEKLAKREANQARYDVFQNKEKDATSVLDLAHIAEQVMQELDDKFYTTKLLTTAEELYRNSGSDFSQGRLLVLSIDRHLQDENWVRRLLDAAADQAGNFTQLLAVTETAGNALQDKNFGQGLVKQYLQSWEQKLDDGKAESPYDYSKLARVVALGTGDNNWVSDLLNKGKALATDHFSFAELGEIALLVEDVQTGENLLQCAADACDSPSQAVQLASRLNENGIATDLVKKLYLGAKGNFTEANDQLDWASGIVQIFKDHEWAKREYDELSSVFASGPAAKRYKASRTADLERTFW